MTYWAIQRPGTFAIFCTWATRIIITATCTTEEILGGSEGHLRKPSAPSEHTKGSLVYQSVRPHNKAIFWIECPAQ